MDDSILFTNFCVEHLGLKPYVDTRRVKRVGKTVPQKLLVYLLSEHTAAEIIQCARELRRSENSYIAKSVFFNRDLSPAEAKAAYDKRVARRSAVATATSSQGSQAAEMAAPVVRQGTTATAAVQGNCTATAPTSSFHL